MNPNVQINFKPFPYVGGGQSIWDIITPRYSYRNGVIKPIHNVERASPTPIPATSPPTPIKKRIISKGLTITKSPIL